MPRALHLHCALVLCVSAWLLPAALAQNADLQGDFALAADQSAGIAAAIETAVANMNFVKRPIARNRLKKTNTAYERIHVAQQADAIELTFDERKPLRLPVNGVPVKWTREDGEVFDVSAQWRGAQLVQTYKAKDGMRVNTFRLGGADQALELEVEVTSGQLPQPVKYTLRYRRVG